MTFHLNKMKCACGVFFLSSTFLGAKADSELVYMHSFDSFTDMTDVENADYSCADEIPGVDEGSVLRVNQGYTSAILAPVINGALNSDTDVTVVVRVRITEDPPVVQGPPSSAPVYPLDPPTIPFDTGHIKLLGWNAITEDYEVIVWTRLGGALGALTGELQYWDNGAFNDTDIRFPSVDNTLIPPVDNIATFAYSIDSVNDTVKIYAAAGSHVSENDFVTTLSGLSIDPFQAFEILEPGDEPVFYDRFEVFSGLDEFGVPGQELILFHEDFESHRAGHWVNSVLAANDAVSSRNSWINLDGVDEENGAWMTVFDEDDTEVTAAWNPTRAAFGYSSGTIPNHGRDIPKVDSGVVVFTATLGRYSDGANVMTGLSLDGTRIGQERNTLFVRYQTSGTGGELLFECYDSNGVNGTKVIGETIRPFIINGEDGEERNIDVRITLDLDADTVEADWRYGDETEETDYENLELNYSTNPVALPPNFSFNRVLIAGNHNLPVLTYDAWVDDLMITQVPSLNPPLLDEDFESYVIGSDVGPARSWLDLANTSVVGSMHARAGDYGSSTNRTNETQAAFGAFSSAGYNAYHGRDIPMDGSGVAVFTATLVRTENGATAIVGLTDDVGTQRGDANTLVFMYQPNGNDGELVLECTDGAGSTVIQATRETIPEAGGDEERNIDVRITLDLNNDTVEADWRYSDATAYNELTLNGSTAPVALPVGFSSFSRALIGAHHASSPDDAWVDDLLLTTTP